jgi:hypothetical protein
MVRPILVGKDPRTSDEIKGGNLAACLPKITAAAIGLLLDCRRQSGLAPARLSN